jgi:hypothetical protein
MSTSITKRILIATAAIVAGVLLVIYFGTQRGGGPAQQTLTDIKDIATLRTQFNLDAGKARLIILVSPT